MVWQRFVCLFVCSLLIISTEIGADQFIVVSSKFKLCVGKTKQATRNIVICIHFEAISFTQLESNVVIKAINVIVVFSLSLSFFFL